MITEHKVSEAADKLINILQYAVENIICKDKMFKQSIWWDETCEMLKKKNINICFLSLLDILIIVTIGQDIKKLNKTLKIRAIINKNN